MTYGVTCECGATQHVSATDAGSRVPCPCGRTIAVPSLSALKASVGQSATSAEVRVDEMLRRGMQPPGDTCLVCQKPTTNTAYAWTACERAAVQQAGGWETSKWWFVTLLFGFLSFRKQTRETSQGRDLRFRLPLRVCGDCTDRLRDPRALKETLVEVPLYAELLDKYPDADVSLDVGLAGLTRRPES